jgi:hypothetical protein
MRDPNLRSDFFSRDRVLLRETLIAFKEGGQLNGAQPEEEAVAFSGWDRLLLELKTPFRDLSRFNRISLACENRSGITLLVGMKLKHGSASTAGGPDVSFSGGREPLAPQGRTELLFPLRSFGMYGTPAGWTDVCCLEISFGFERGHVGSNEIAVALSSICGERVESPPGPRLTERGFAVVVRPDAGFAHHDDAEAQTLRLGLRLLPRWALVIPPPHPYPRETADEILAGRIMGQRLSIPPVWDANPLGAQEWTHFLNRHHFMRELVIALEMGIGRGHEPTCSEPGRDSSEMMRQTRYVTTLDAYVSSWVNSNPVPVDSNGGSGPSWETLSAAWRLREWLWIAQVAWKHPLFRRGTQSIMLRSVWEHCTHLMDHRGHPNNWIIVEAAALTLAGLTFPDFVDSERWVNVGMERLGSEFHRQFLDDGVHFEISPLYHALCGQAVLEVRCAAQTAGYLHTPVPDHALERSFEYLSAICRPDFTWPSLNDGGSVDADYSALMRAAGEVFQRPDFTWVGTRGMRGRPPEEASRVFHTAGIAVMRSHYGSDANFLIFRAGPAGAAHVHADTLSLDVTGMGAPRLVDPGVTTYAPDPLTDHYRSAAAHNAVLVDGEGPVRTALPFAERIRPAGEDLTCWSEGSLEFAAGICRGPWSSGGEILLRRTVVFVRREYWVVQDLLTGTGEHELTVCWQFAAGRVEVLPGTLSATVIDARGSGFELLPVISGSIEMETFTGSLCPVRGWVSMEGRDMPAFAYQYRIRGPLPITQEWLLVPFSGRPDCEVSVSRTENQGGSVVLEIAIPSREPDVITLSRSW